MRWSQLVGTWFALSSSLFLGSAAAPATAATEADVCQPDSCDDSVDCFAAQEDLEALSASTLLLQAGLRQSRGAAAGHAKASQPSLQSARASVRSNPGLPEGRSDERPTSKTLIEAAMAAAALAVAEEAAAAEAVGGGKNARLLASTRVEDTRHLEEDEEQAVTKHLKEMGLESVMHRGLPPQGGLPPSGGFPAAQGSYPPTTGGGVPAAAQAPGKDSGKPPAGGLPPAQAPSGGGKTPSGFGGQIAEGGNPFAHFNIFDPFKNPYWNPFANPFSNPFAVSGKGTAGKWYTSGLFMVICLSLVVVIFVGCGVMAFSNDDDDDSSGEDESDSDGLFGRLSGRKQTDKESDRLYKDLLGVGSQRRHGRFCCGLCWCCSKNVFLFFAAAVLFTIFAGVILWNTGILQPLLAQLLLYTYIIVLVMAFVSVLAWEGTSAFRKAFAVVFGKVASLDGAFSIFKGKGTQRMPRF